MSFAKANALCGSLLGALRRWKLGEAGGLICLPPGSNVGVNFTPWKHRSDQIRGRETEGQGLPGRTGDTPVQGAGHLGMAFGPLHPDTRNKIKIRIKS